MRTVGFRPMIAQRRSVILIGGRPALFAGNDAAPFCWAARELAAARLESEPTNSLLVQFAIGPPAKDIAKPVRQTRRLARVDQTRAGTTSAVLSPTLNCGVRAPADPIRQGWPRRRRSTGGIQGVRNR